MLEEKVRLRTDELEQALKNLQNTQSQLVNQEKMASLGQLTAGIAHEINNPIGFISSNLQTLQDYATRLLKLTVFYEKIVSKTANETFLALQRDIQQRLQFDFVRTDLPELLSESIDGNDRVAEIVKNLKAFSHVDNAQWQPANLVDGLENTLKIAANQLKYHVEIHRDYAADLPEVYCQPNQINQVLLNLLVNAAHAITKERGTITISTGIEGTNVWVDVQDTGAGIAAENMQRIFDPFFTTKPVGKGTGLGLAMVRSIVTRMGGSIECHSEVGVGTNFGLLLPAKPTPD